MSSLATSFATFIFCIVAFFIYILVPKSAVSLEYESAVKNISSLTKLPGISLSTPFIENRIRVYDDYSNNFYFGMKKNTYTGFVYAK